MRGLSTSQTRDVPYQSQAEYLQDLSAAMDLYLLRIVKKKLETEKNMPEREALLRTAENILQHHLGDENASMSWEKFSQIIEDRREFTLDVQIRLSLEEMLCHTTTPNFTRNLLLLTWMLAWYPQYQTVIQALDPAQKGQITLGFAVQLFLFEAQEKTPYSYSMIDQYSSPLYCYFPALEYSENPIEEPLLCDAQLMDLLMDTRHVFPFGVSVFRSNSICEPLLFRESLYAQVLELAQQERMPLTLLWGEEGIGKKHLLQHVASGVKRDLFFYDLSSKGKEDEKSLVSLQKNLLYVVRDCVFANGMLALTSWETLQPEEMQILATWLKQDICPKVGQVFLVAQMEEYRHPLYGVFPVKVGPFDSLQYIALWEHLSQEYEWEPGVSWEQLANIFPFTPGQMKKALYQAELLSGNTHVLTHNLLYQVCYAQLHHHLEDKAIRVRPAFCWDDLKLPLEQKEILRDVCSCVKNQHIVLNQWNFQKILPYGRGVAVLFSGPPGTGKTMAAQVVAAELHMELYKVDLSQVIDKYIGETEKNIKAIFEQAQKSNSILFFDEADAIFNKRLEASGANERFANIESSLLLQCIEEYRGISILATNHFASMDAAFIRRFRYYIYFQEPDEQIRYEIWKSVFPKEAPLSPEVDLQELAHTFALTGAVIKNIAVSAAYLAARHQKEIGLSELLCAIRREMEKNGLTLSREKMGSLGYSWNNVK